jgi:hypothetical protein
VQNFRQAVVFRLILHRTAFLKMTHCLLSFYQIKDKFSERAYFSRTSGWHGFRFFSQLRILDPKTFVGYSHGKSNWH